MEASWTLEGAGEHLLRLRYRELKTRHAATVRPVLTVRDACRHLRKSRRQIYRYVQAGRLTPSGRILGQWLFAKSDVDQLAHAALPRSLGRFFWDVRLSDLSVGTHRDFILARLLEQGDRAAVQWAFHAYPRHAIVEFLSGRGAALLSQRAWHFWSSYLCGPKAVLRPQRSWRRSGRAWGGIE